MRNDNQLISLLVEQTYDDATSRELSLSFDVDRSCICISYNNKNVEIPSSWRFLPFGFNNTLTEEYVSIQNILNLNPELQKILNEYFEIEGDYTEILNLSFCPNSKQVAA